MKIGEEIAVSNGVDGREYRCEVAQLLSDEVVCKLRFIKENDVELPAQVYLFQGLPKADKMELIIQKAVELGAVIFVGPFRSRQGKTFQQYVVFCQSCHVVHLSVVMSYLMRRTLVK